MATTANTRKRIALRNTPLLLIAALFIFLVSAQSAFAANAWTEVFPGGLGPANTEIMPIESVPGELRVGTMNPAGGGEIWRSTDGIGWSPLQVGGFGDARNQGVWSDTIHNGIVSAGVFNPFGAQIFHETGTGNWVVSNMPGLSRNNVQFHGFIPFGGYLYAGTTNPTEGGEIWRTANGLDWNRVASVGLSNIYYDPAPFSEQLSPIGVFGSYLYVGAVNRDRGAEIWRTDGTTWTRVLTGGRNTKSNFGVFGVGTVKDGFLYVGVHNNDTGGEIWRTDNGTTWTRAIYGGFGDRNNRNIRVRGLYNNCLYAGTLNTATGTEVWASCDGRTWSQSSLDGFGDPANFNISGTFTEFNGNLYIGTKNASGGQLWSLHLNKTGAMRVNNATLVDETGARVSIGGLMGCDIRVGANSLNADWAGAQFRSTGFASSYCYDDPGFDTGSFLDFDTQRGVVYGTLNGVQGYRITWRVADHGFGTDAVFLYLSGPTGTISEALGSISSGTVTAAP